MQDLTTIRHQLSSRELFDAFRAQLVKDFGQSNCSTDFLEALEPDYSTILEKISAELQRNEKRSDFNIMSLLYRIDISEAQLKQYVNENIHENYFNVMTELIIKRVLQKVVIKRWYQPGDSL